MMRGFLAVFVFVSVIFFPWPFAVVIVLASSICIPSLPLAAGLFADTLYYTPHATFLPIFTLYGALVTAVVLFVRSRLKTGSIRG
jgi:cation transporter-like permease